MPNPKKLTSINLVPQDEFDKSLIGKILKWSLTTGKSIVILTEFVVIMAFLSRFKLDRDLNDLNEGIIQKQNLVDAYSDIEQKILDLQNRLTLVGEIDNTSVSVSDNMALLARLTPLDTKLESVELSQSGWNIKGVSGSEQGFATFVTQLDSEPRFDSIEVGDLRFDIRKGGLAFSVVANYPKAEAKKTTVSKSSAKSTEEEP